MLLKPELPLMDTSRRIREEVKSAYIIWIQCAAYPILTTAANIYYQKAFKTHSRKLEFILNQ